MKRIVAAALLTLALVVHAQDAPRRLVVHEWGTFTSVYGADGTIMEWRPTIGDDLPEFVYGRASIAAPAPAECKKVLHETKQRMETPVLYFYSDRETTVDVTVRFPKGLITEWYPRVREFAPALGDGTTPVAVAGGMLRWGKVRLLPKAALEKELPTKGDSNHYYHARQTDSDFVRVCGTREGEASEIEKYLFYRGVGNFDLPLQVRTQEGLRFTVSNPGRAALGRLFVIHVNADRSGLYKVVDSVRAGGTLDIALSGTAVPHAQLLRALGADLEAALVREGLYAKEAASMVATWNDSYFETPGTRLLYLLPQAMTEALLPLTIEPKPTELKRVLVARVDIMTPEQSRSLASLIGQLGDESFDVREAASKRIASFGRFAEPALREVMRTSDDAEVTTRAKALIEKLAPRR